MADYDFSKSAFERGVPEHGLSASQMFSAGDGLTYRLDDIGTRISIVQKLNFR
jgi:hypothetical protein